MPVWEKFTTVADIAPETIEHYRELVPPLIAQAYTEHGTGFIGNGLLRLVDPAYASEHLREIAHVGDHVVPILTTAFGDVIYWVEPFFFLASYRWGVVDILAYKDDNFVQLVTKQDFINNVLSGKLYEQAVQRFGGAPDLNTCYAHVPLLGLGGREDVTMLDPCDMWIHLQLILQSCGYPREVWREETRHD